MLRPNIDAGQDLRAVSLLWVQYLTTFRFFPNIGMQSQHFRWVLCPALSDERDVLQRPARTEVGLRSCLIGAAVCAARQWAWCCIFASG